MLTTLPKWCRLVLVGCLVMSIGPRRLAADEANHAEAETAIERSNIVMTTGCAANAVFVLCKLEQIDTDYEHCLSLLPCREEGNTLLEVTKALESLDLRAAVFRMNPAEIASLQRPAILLSGAIGDESPSEERIGHFYVVRPVNALTVQVLDFPGYKPVILTRARFGRAIENTVNPTTVACFYDRMATPQLTDVIGEPINLWPQGKPGSGVQRESVIRLTGSITDSRSTTWDFGSLRAEQTIDREFTIENHSPGRLSIAKVTPSCGCTGIRHNKDFLDPGESVLVSVTINLKGKHGYLNESIVVTFAPDEAMSPVTMNLIGKIVDDRNETNASTTAASDSRRDFSEKGPGDLAVSEGTSPAATDR